MYRATHGISLKKKQLIQNSLRILKNSEILQCAVVVLTAFFATVLFVPSCKRLAYRLDLVDRPRTEQHKQHTRETPLLGGFAMFAGWTLTLLAAFAVLQFTGFLPETLRSALDLSAGGREMLAVCDSAASDDADADRFVIRAYHNRVFLSVIAALCAVNMDYPLQI